MIKFFRKIRQNLLIENKTGRYLKYAIGEIFLVVIGILIAVQINNYYKKKNDEAIVDSLLSEVLEEIKYNIEYSKAIYKKLGDRDTLFSNVLKRKVTRKDYLKPNNAYVGLLSGFSVLQFNDDSFKNLIEFSGARNTTQDSIINSLKDIYPVQKLITESMFEMSKKTLSDNNDYFKKNKPWYHKLHSKEIDDEYINYALEDPYYLNFASEFGMMIVMTYARQANLCVERFTPLYLTLSNYLEKEIDSTLVNTSIDLDQFTGTFVAEQDTLKIELIDKSLTYSYQKYQGSFMPQSEDSFFLGNKFANPVRNNQNEIIAIRTRICYEPTLLYKKIN